MLADRPAESGRESGQCEFEAAREPGGGVALFSYGRTDDNYLDFVRRYEPFFKGSLVNNILSNHWQCVSLTNVGQCEGNGLSSSRQHGLATELKASGSSPSLYEDQLRLTLHSWRSYFPSVLDWPLPEPLRKEAS